MPERTPEASEPRPAELTPAGAVERPGPEGADASAPVETRRRGARDGGNGIVCRLTTLHPERNLARAVCNYLADEMPDVRFTLRREGPVHAIWICGYERGHVEVVRRARRKAAGALIVVTGRAPLDDWRDEVVAAGADHACAWPLPYAELSRLLHDKRSQAIA